MYEHLLSLYGSIYVFNSIQMLTQSSIIWMNEWMNEWRTSRREWNVFCNVRICVCVSVTSSVRFVILSFFCFAFFSMATWLVAFQFEFYEFTFLSILFVYVFISRAVPFSISMSLMRFILYASSASQRCCCIILLHVVLVYLLFIFNFEIFVWPWLFVVKRIALNTSL